MEHKRVESTITECAHLMANLDVEPHRYIYECLKEIDPVLAEGWWDNVKATASNVWQGVKSFAGDTARGAAKGWNKAVDTVAGPVAKFDAAVRALEDLEKTLGSNPTFNNFQSSEGRGTVLQYIQAVKKALMKDKDSIPQLQNTQMTQNYDTRANVKSQQDAAAAARSPAAAPGTAPAPAAAAS